MKVHLTLQELLGLVVGLMGCEHKLERFNAKTEISVNSRKKNTWILILFDGSKPRTSRLFLIRMNKVM